MDGPKRVYNSLVEVVSCGTMTIQRAHPQPQGRALSWLKSYTRLSGICEFCKGFSMKDI